MLPVSPKLELASTSELAECVLWVDGVQGVVRAMDVVPAGAGPEVVVRTLLQAMEHPSGPEKPARPQKIVVCDRQIQFFLRGALQQLGIVIDYAPELPLIDEIFRGLQEVVRTPPPPLPPQYTEALLQKAEQIWQDAPWELLEEHQVLAIELNRWELETLYVSVLMEYGILLYRSLESLRQFRQQMLMDESSEQLEEVFLRQDCLFLTFDSDDLSDLEADLTDLPASAVQPAFGNLHPLEGLRSFLYDEEASVVLVILEALHRFFQQHRSLLKTGTFPAISSHYRVPIPQAPQAKDAGAMPIKVKTLPKLAAELLEMESLVDPGEDLSHLLEGSLRDDLVPENSYLSLGVIPWDLVIHLRARVEHLQPKNVRTAGDGLPIILIQTSRPKAKLLIQDIEHSGGLEAICFNPGENPLDGDRYDLGILQTADGEMHLFGEFNEDDPVHLQARHKWDQRCQKTEGWCGLVIAMGVTGASRGSPHLRDMLALFEARSLRPADLGLGTLQLIPQLDE